MLDKIVTIRFDINEYDEIVQNTNYCCFDTVSQYIRYSVRLKNKELNK